MLFLRYAAIPLLFLLLIAILLRPLLPKRSTAWSWTIRLAIAHLILVLLVFALDYQERRGEAPGAGVWVFIVIDFPTSLGYYVVGPIAQAVLGRSFIMRNYTIPYTFVGTLGTAQYAAIGWWIDRELRTRREEAEETTDVYE